MVACKVPCALPGPRGYLGNILLVRIIGVYIPKIGAVAYVLLAAKVSFAEPIGILIALLAAMLAGAAATLLVLHHLLKPVSAAANALSGISKTEPSRPC